MLPIGVEWKCSTTKHIRIHATVKAFSGTYWTLMVEKIAIF